MTSFRIDSIVREDGSIVIPSPSLVPGTAVHVVVTPERHSGKEYSVDDFIDSLDGLLEDCDPASVENARLDYLTEKYQ